jgi:RNA polymerase sigma-70 factor (ECF subfamily)
MDVQQARDLEALIPNLRRYARVLVRDPDRADDMVQDCLERAISRHHLFSPGTNLRAWLFTILVNLVRSDARRDKARGTVVTIDDYRQLISSPAAQDDALRMRDLRRAFSRLAAPFQEVLILVTLEGLSYEEAAEVIGVPVGTVRSRLFRAREQIKRHMEEPAREVPGKSRPAVPRRAPASHGTDRLPAIATG